MLDDNIYKIIEIAGSSESSIEEAIQGAIARANSTIENLRWFEVVQVRGHLENGRIGHYQVTLKVGFTLNEA